MNVEFVNTETNRHIDLDHVITQINKGNPNYAESLKIIQLSEQHRRLVVITAMGLRRKSGTLLPSYTDDELEEATFGFDKFYVQSVHYDDLVKENETLRKNLDAEIAWRTRDD